MRAYIDADVLIWHLRGQPKATTFLKALKADEGHALWVGAMQRAEVVFFMRPGEEENTMAFLSMFSTAPATQAVVDKAAALYRRWHPSHGIDINDAMLAATAIETGGVIYCLNTKHYPMPEAMARKAW